MPSACPKPNRPSEVRLHKYLADCGVASRRACERLIEEGRVAVDGAVIAPPGIALDPSLHSITVDGRAVGAQKLVHLILNKPRGYLCTSSDPRGRLTFHRLLPPLPERLYSAGRLDVGSEGLLLVTNDGELVQRLIHPRHEIAKTYTVWLDAPLEPAREGELCAGMELDGESLRMESCRRMGADHHGVFYEVVLRQGKNRQIRRMMEAAGRRVRRILRTRLGPLTLDGMRAGEWRHLTEEEVRKLQREG